MDWDELCYVDIGDGQNMLLFDELLEMLGDNLYYFYIEIKYFFGQGDVFEEQLVLCLCYVGFFDDFCIYMIFFFYKVICWMQFFVFQVDCFYLWCDWECYFLDIFLFCLMGLGMLLLCVKMCFDDIGVFDLFIYLWIVDRFDDMKWVWLNGIDIFVMN